MEMYLPWKAVKSGSEFRWTIWIEDARGNEIVPWTAFDMDGTPMKKQWAKARLIARAVNAIQKVKS